MAEEKPGSNRLVGQFLFSTSPVQRAAVGQVDARSRNFHNAEVQTPEVSWPAIRIGD